MKKIVIHTPGSTSRLKIEDHKDLSPSDDQILIDVEHSGINFADVCIRLGVYDSAWEYEGYPITPGFEYAGKVKAIGKNISKFKVGDDVFGVTRFGAYANQVVSPEHQVYPLPKSFSSEQAAGFPAVYLTAYHALFQLFVLHPNSTVLVHSAAGGVGTAMLQLLKITGHKSIGVVGSSHKVEVAQRFGADWVIDKSKEDLWAKVKEIAPNGVDVIMDGNGPSTMKEGMNHLRPIGKMVSFGFHSMFSTTDNILLKYAKMGFQRATMPTFNPINMLGKNISLICFNLSFLFDRMDLLSQGMDQMTKWIEQGKLDPPQTKVFDYAKVADAHNLIESGQSTGKLILKF